MIKKTLISSLIVLSILILGGCGRGLGDTQTISFVNFTLSIPEEFVSVPPGLVENKQIINKVLTSYKIENESGYNPNIVITQSTISPSLSYNDFATANEQKLLSQLVGFIPGPKELVEIECSETQTIRGIITSFTVRNAFYEGTGIYYVHQYQFVANLQGYIISYATDQEGDEKLFKNIVKSLECI